MDPTYSIAKTLQHQHPVLALFGLVQFLQELRFARNRLLLQQYLSLAAVILLLTCRIAPIDLNLELEAEPLNHLRMPLKKSAGTIPVAQSHKPSPALLNRAHKPARACQLLSMLE